MKTIKNLTALFTIAILITSCAKDDSSFGTNVPQSKQEIILNSGISLATRAGLQDTQIINGQQVSLHITKYAEAANYVYKNTKLTADGSGGLTAGTALYYPATGNIDIYAVHPFIENMPLDVPSPFSIIADQTADKDYLNSDLLHVAKTNVAKSHNAVGLKFYHKLSKVEFTIVEGDDIDINGLESVRIEGVLPGTTIDPISGDITPAEGTPVSIIAHGIPTEDTEDTSVSGISAIVVPQSIASGTKIIKVTINGAVYSYTTTSEWIFEEGKKHKLKLTINEAGITLTSSIEDWTDTAEIIGDGVADN